MAVDLVQPTVRCSVNTDRLGFVNVVAFCKSKRKGRRVVGFHFESVVFSFSVPDLQPEHLFSPDFATLRSDTGWDLFFEFCTSIGASPYGLYDQLTAVAAGVRRLTIEKCVEAGVTPEQAIFLFPPLFQFHDEAFVYRSLSAARARRAELAADIVSGPRYAEKKALDYYLVSLPA